MQGRTTVASPVLGGDMALLLLNDGSRSSNNVGSSAIKRVERRRVGSATESLEERWREEFRLAAVLAIDDWRE